VDSTQALASQPTVTTYVMPGLRDLAEAAHIRAASLYNHFSSKDELARLAMSLYSASQRAELSVLEQATTGAERLRGYLIRAGFEAGRPPLSWPHADRRTQLSARGGHERGATVR
jgi:AcrR family transcriptional regulator